MRDQSTPLQLAQLPEQNTPTLVGAEHKEERLYLDLEICVQSDKIEALFEMEVGGITACYTFAQIRKLKNKSVRIERINLGANYSTMHYPRLFIAGVPCSLELDEFEGPFLSFVRSHLVANSRAALSASCSRFDLYAAFLNSIHGLSTLKMMTVAFGGAPSEQFIENQAYCNKNLEFLCLSGDFSNALVPTLQTLLFTQNLVVLDVRETQIRFGIDSFRSCVTRWRISHKIVTLKGRLTGGRLNLELFMICESYGCQRLYTLRDLGYELRISYQQNEDEFVLASL